MIKLSKECQIISSIVVLLLSAVPVGAFYNPSQGRWLSRDPIEEGGGINVYGFSGNSPITHIDLLGNDFIAVAGRAVSGAAPANHYSIQYWLSCGQEAPHADILSGDGIGGYPGNNTPLAVPRIYLGNPFRP